MLATKNKLTLGELRVRWQIYADCKRRFGYSILHTDLTNGLFWGGIVGVLGILAAQIFSPSVAAARLGFSLGLFLAVALIIAIRCLDFWLVLRSDWEIEQGIEEGLQRFRTAILATKWLGEIVNLDEEDRRCLEDSLRAAASELSRIPPKETGIGAWVWESWTMLDFSYDLLEEPLILVLKATGASFEWTQRSVYNRLGWLERFVLLVKAIMQTDLGERLFQAGAVPDSVACFLNTHSCVDLAAAQATRNLVAASSQSLTQS
jgi:hypothetical protein